MTLETEIGISNFRNEWQKASLSILYTHGILFNTYERFFKEKGLTTQQFNILRILGDQYPEPVTTSFLRERMLDKMSDASRLVNRLANKGLVSVSPNTSDKRLVNILLTEKGLETVSLITGSYSVQDELLSGITEEEAAQLSKLLYKARESIKSVHAAWQARTNEEGKEA